MSILVEKINKNNGIEEVWVVNSDNKNDKKIVFSFNKKAKTLIYYFGKEHCVSSILIEDCTSLPKFLAEKGYFKQGIGYYLDKMMYGIKIKKILISKNKDNSFVGNELVIKYDSLLELQKGISNINTESKKDKSDYVNNFFHSLFPKSFKKVEDSSSKKAKKVLRILDNSIIEHLGPDDINKFIDFFGILLKTKYSSQISRGNLLSLAKIKVDDIAIDEIISKFEHLISSDSSESVWGKFLEKNLFLLDSKYIKSISQLNLVLAGARNVDFGLMDSYGYLDIFEIKKPTTKLLAVGKDRGNYYWSTDAIKAITQAEKYLYNAEKKASILAEDIEREKNGLKVKIVRPRAILLMGNTSQLNDSAKLDDFKVLRNSLKNIEIMTYDELLIRLKNQKNKIYVKK